MDGVGRTVWGEPGGYGVAAGRRAEGHRRGQFAKRQRLTGYSVLEAESMEAALALLDGHPHLAWGEGFEIEIHESLPMTL